MTRLSVRVASTSRHGAFLLCVHEQQRYCGAYGSTHHQTAKRIAQRRCPCPLASSPRDQEHARHNGEGAWDVRRGTFGRVGSQYDLRRTAALCELDASAVERGVAYRGRLNEKARHFCDGPTSSGSEPQLPSKRSEHFCEVLVISQGLRVANMFRKANSY